MTPTTKVYSPRPRTEAPVEEAPVCRINLNGLTKETIMAEIERIRQLPASPGMNPRLAICLVIDLSGSMTPYVDMIHTILREMITQLQLVTFRDYTLDVILIHNSFARTIYYGDVKALNLEMLLSLLPAPNGMTPYADALTQGARHMDMLYGAVEQAGQWHNPCGVFLCVTDSKNTCKNGLAITEELSKAFLEEKRVVAEFVTQRNEAGLCHGGYKIFIDRSNSETLVASFMQALRVGSSSVTALAGNYHVPERRDRAAWNRFLAQRLFAEIAASYERSILPNN